MPNKVSSDRMTGYKRKMSEPYLMIDYEPVSVDMNGARTFPRKNDPANLANAAKDIKDIHGLHTEGPIAY